MNTENLVRPATEDELAALVERAAGLVRPGRRALLGITGAPGAGKTTLARSLVEALAAAPPPGCAEGEWVAHVPMDGYHLADVELRRLGRAERKGAPDTFDAGGYAALLHRLQTDLDDVVYAPAFDREIEQPVAGSIPVHPSCRLVVSEGNYLLLEDAPWPRVTDCFDEVWFCDLDDAERRRRLVERHVRFGKSPDAAHEWVHGPDERNAELVRGYRDRATLVVP
jgi:pantothenate kinase